MNTTQNTQRIIAIAIIAVTAGLALASCAPQAVPEPVQQLTNAQVAELRAGLTDLAESRAELSRDLAEQRATAHAERAQGMLDLAESRAELSRDLAEQRAIANSNTLECGSDESHLRLGTSSQ
jgi:Skp family chaperone for outer membrane proteins